VHIVWLSGDFVEFIATLRRSNMTWVVGERVSFLRSRYQPAIVSYRALGNVGVEAEHKIRIGEVALNNS